MNIPLFIGFHTSQVVVWDFSLCSEIQAVMLGMYQCNGHMLGFPFCRCPNAENSTGHKYHEPPKTMKNKGVGHLKTRLFAIKACKNVGFGGAHGRQRCPTVDGF